METTKKIEAYLDGSLNTEEMIAMESLAARDAAFASLIRFHKEVNESIRDTELHDLRVAIKEIVTKEGYVGRDDQKQSQGFAWSIGKRKYLQVAASIVLIALAAITLYWLVFAKPSGERLYASYYQTYDAGMIDRAGDNELSKLSEAMMNYELGFYPRAFSQFSEIVKHEPENYQARLFLGLTCLELRKPEDAIVTLSEIPEQWENPYVVHRNWYLALAFLKTNRNEDALVLFENIRQSGSYYSEKADKIIRKLRK